MSTESEEHDHEGKSPAAWAAVYIMLAAFTVGTVAFFLDIPWLVWSSAGLLVVGAIVGKLLARAGYGVGGDKLKSREHR